LCWLRDAMLGTSQLPTRILRDRYVVFCGHSLLTMILVPTRLSMVRPPAILEASKIISKLGGEYE